MNDSEKLKIMLKDLIQCFEGPWFVGDGALLGLIRKGDLLDFDDDLDIFILPETKINWNKLPNKYGYNKDYVCYKVYDKLGREPATVSPWLRYIQYMRICPENKGSNRAELLQVGSSTYSQERIEMKYKSPWIDIFILEKDIDTDNYVVPYYFNKDKIFHYTPENLKLDINYDLGYPINIPHKAEEVLERQYGEDWMIEDRNFLY